MGEQRREDNRHDVRKKPIAADREVDHEDEAFDDQHAHRQVQARSWGTVTIGAPERMVDGIGDQEQLATEFDAAVDAKQGGNLLKMVGDMGREQRVAAVGRIDEVAPLLAGGDFLRFADLTQASLSATLSASFSAKPPPTLHQMRAYLSDTHPSELAMAFYDAALLAKFKAQYPGPVANVLPQVADQDGLKSANLLRWYLDTTPAGTVAREMMSASLEEAPARGYMVNEIGRLGWLWVSHIDDAIAATAARGVLEIYAQYAIHPDVKDLQKVLEGKAAARNKVDPKKLAAELRGDRRAFIKDSSATEIEHATKAAGMSVDEELEWLLDKPDLKLEDLREAASVWSTEAPGFSSTRVIERVRAKFPSAKPADAFGFIPDGLYRLAIRNAAVRPWLVDGAEPFDVLRLVAFDPDHIAALCKWLVTRGTGYGWIYQLSGGRDDHLLRRFVLQCPDATVATYVRTRLLADAINTEGTEVTSSPNAQSAYQPASADFDEAIAAHDKGKKLAAGVDALSDEDVTELRHDAVKLRTVLQRSDADSIVRVLDRVQPHLRDALNAFPNVKNPAGLADWVRARPADQVREALAHQVASARAKQVLPDVGPLELFPPLELSAILAPVLQRNPAVAEWILASSEPIAALVALGAPGVAMPAVLALASSPDAADALPPGAMLPRAAHDGLAQLVALSKGDLHDALSAKLREKPTRDEDEVTDPQHNAQVIKDSDSSSLVQALTAAFDAPGSASAAVLLRVCRTHTAEARTVAKDGALVKQLHDGTQLSPAVVFPGVSLGLFMKTPQGRAWVFKTVPSFEILRKTAVDHELAGELAAALDRGDDELWDWIKDLPRGRALNPAERRALRALATAVTDEGYLRRLFGVRFDTPLRSGYDKTELDRMWTILERIPQAHIEQGSVSEFTEFQGASGNGTAGAYYPESHAITIRDGLEKDKTGNDQYDRSGASAKMTRDQAKAALHIDDATFEKMVQDSKLWLADPKAMLYQLMYVPETDPFTTTVLHEVGHAVDAMLGNHSELVFGLAGWRAYAESDFDQWATELGGWDSVAAADQKQIREVWTMWLSGSRGNQARESVGEMVASNHPAVAKRYSSVGVVQLATQHKRPSIADPAVIGAKAALVNHGQQRFYTLGVDAMRVAPSEYSLTAPAEYFAECYAYYYKDYDGTPDTAQTKGERLAPWIKTWFDKHIDTVGHNPKKH
jgi:hypothetical protein